MYKEHDIVLRRQMLHLWMNIIPITIYNNRSNGLKQVIFVTRNRQSLQAILNTLLHDRCWKMFCLDPSLYNFNAPKDSKLGDMDKNNYLEQ